MCEKPGEGHGVYAYSVAEDEIRVAGERKRELRDVVLVEEILGEVGVAGYHCCGGVG